MIYYTIILIIFSPLGLVFTVVMLTGMDTYNFKLSAQVLGAEIKNLLDEDTINRFAEETGFIRRDGGKLDGYKFLDMLLFTHFNQKELSLNAMSGQLRRRYGIEIKKQSIDERFTGRAVEFFKVVLEKAINISIGPNEKIDFIGCDKVRIKDSTSFQLPENMKDVYKGSGGSGSKSCIRIQFEYDLKNRDILDLSLHPYTEQDMIDAKDTIDDIQENNLVIRDLGYILISNLRKIEERGAFYLNRLHSGTNVYEKKNGEFVELYFWSLYLYMKKMNLPSIEKEVYIGKEEKFMTRMIIELMPDNIYNDRLRKAYNNTKKKYRNISKKYKAQMGLNIYITNTKISKKHIRLIYTLRWQIELMFKIWKSIGEIDEVKKMKVKRFEVCLIAKLIWIVINWQIMRRIVIYYFNEYNIALSPYKLFVTFKDALMDFRNALKKGLKYVISLIEEFADMSKYNHISEKKKHSITWSYDVYKCFINAKY